MPIMTENIKNILGTSIFQLIKYAEKKLNVTNPSYCVCFVQYYDLKHKCILRMQPKIMDKMRWNVLKNSGLTII